VGATYIIKKTGGDYDTIQHCLLDVDLSFGDNILELRPETPGTPETWILASAITIAIGDTGVVFHPNILRGQAGETIILDANAVYSRAITLNACSYWQISNFTLRNGTDSCIGNGGSAISNITIDHITIDSPATNVLGISVYTGPCSDITIEDFVISGIGGTAISISHTEDLIIRRGTITGCGNTGWTSNGVYIIDGCTDFLCEDVSVINHQPSSVPVGSAFAATSTESAGTNGRFNRCVANNSGVQNFKVTGDDTGRDIVYFDNCYATGGASGYTKYAFLVGEASTGYYRNCTVDGIYTVAMVYFAAASGPHNVNVINCILAGTAPHVYCTNTTWCTLTASYNCLYGGAVSFAEIDGIGQAHTFAEWRGHGYDATGSINVNPFLTGYVLASISPCINAGTTLADVTTDIRGYHRPYGIYYDIGAYEYSFWLSTLPQEPNEDGFTETPPNIILRTPMDVGPAKVRKRLSTNIRSITVQYTLTPAQILILDDLYVNVLYSGAYSFDCVHPRTQDPITVRFVSPPSYTAIEGGMYKANLSLEILP
jgi:hypothetical protein